MIYMLNVLNVMMMMVKYLLIYHQYHWHRYIAEQVAHVIRKV